MADYQKMYTELAAAMSNSIEEMEKALQETEEIYIYEEKNFYFKNSQKQKRLKKKMRVLSNQKTFSILI